MDPKRTLWFHRPLSFHRVFSLCVCHASCCHLKLMNSNDFTARRRHSVLYVLHGNRRQRLPEQFLDCWSVLRIKRRRDNLETIMLLRCDGSCSRHVRCSGFCHRPPGLGVRENPFSPLHKKMLLRATSAETNGMPL